MSKIIKQDDWKDVVYMIKVGNLYVESVRNRQLNLTDSETNAMKFTDREMNDEEFSGYMSEKLTTIANHGLVGKVIKKTTVMHTLVEEIG